MLMEISRIDLLLELVTEDVHERVCLYLIRYAGWGVATLLGVTPPLFIVQLCEVCS